MKKKRTVPIGLVCLWIITGLWITISLLIPYIRPVNLAETDLLNRYAMPSIFGISDSGFLLGADYLGRDILIRLLYATRTTFSIAIVGLLCAAVLGIGLGVLAGIFGGLADDLVMFIVNIRQSIPSIIIGIIVASTFGSSYGSLLLLISLVQWTSFAKQARAQVIQIKTENYIECSRAIGASTIRIIFEHVLRNIAAPLIVVATSTLSSIILFESSLSFLGLGIQAPNTSLGVMVDSGRGQMILQWWQALIPASVIIVVVMTVSLTGDWLTDKLDPKLKQKK